MSRPLNLVRREMVHWLQKVDAKGWVANHDGNLSARLPANRYLLSPTSFSKGEIKEQDLLVTTKTGKVVQGRHRPFSEWALHRRAYELRNDIQVVLHAHPPMATGLAVAGHEVDPCIVAEAVVSLGARIPLAPYALPGSEASVDVLNDLLPYYDVVLLENHGVLSIGKDLEQAFLRMELCEHLARIQVNANQAGGAKRIPKADIEQLLHKRTKAGLGPEARGLSLPDSDKSVQLVGPCSGPLPQA